MKTERPALWWNRERGKPTKGIASVNQVDYTVVIDNCIYAIIALSIPHTLTVAQARCLKTRHAANGILATLVSHTVRVLRHTIHFPLQAVRDARS